MCQKTYCGVSCESSHALEVTCVKCNVIGIHSNRHISVVLMVRGMRGFAVVAYYLRVVKVKLEQRKGWATELALTQS